MYDRAVTAPAGTRLTIEAGEESRTVELYSPEGMKLVAALWVKLAAEFRLMYQPSWLGRSEERRVGKECRL